MKLFIKQTFSQFVGFGFVGVLNTAISLAVYYLFIYIDSGLYLVGNVVGFILSTLNAYFWNSKFIFNKKRCLPNNDSAGLTERSRKTVSEIIKTFISYGVSLGLSTLLLCLWISILRIPETIAPIINLIITIPLNFCMNKFWVYKTGGRK